MPQNPAVTKIWFPLLLMWPVAASAHSPVAGVMPFYAGVLHPFVVPAHVMAMLLLGLFIGRQPKAQYGRLSAVFLASLALALALSALAGEPDTDRALLVGILGVAGAMALARPRTWPPALAVAVMGAGAILLGLGSGPQGVAGSSRWLHLAGTWLGILIGVGWVWMLAERARRPWQAIALRVLASWLAASALLVLSLALAGRTPGASP